MQPLNINCTKFCELFQFEQKNQGIFDSILITG